MSTAEAAANEKKPGTEGAAPPAGTQTPNAAPGATGGTPSGAAPTTGAGAAGSTGGAPGATGASAGTPDTSGTPQPPEKKQPVALGDDDELPEGAELLQLSRQALGKRLERSTKKQLKELFGTDNVEEIKAKQNKIKEWEAEQERQRVANLSETERLKEEAASWKSKFEKLEGGIKEERRSRRIAATHSIITEAAKKHIDPAFLDTELIAFAREVASKFTKEQLDAMDPSKYEEHFKNRVAAIPKLGKDFGVTTSTETQTTQTQTTPKTVPMNNGTKDNARPTARSEGSGLPTNGQKDFRPGTPNSMNTHEAHAAAQREGYGWK